MVEKFKNIISQSFGFFLACLYSYGIFYFLKMRILQRNDLPDSPLFYSYQDVLIFSLFAIFLVLIKKPLRIILFLFFFMTTLNILFISKTGYPITQSLLSQVGDFMILQTSVKSPSIYRNIFILIGLCGVFLLLAYLPWSKFQKRKTAPFLGLSLIVVNLFFLFPLFLQPTLQHSQLSYNFFYSMVKKPVTLDKLIKGIEEKYGVEKNFSEEKKASTPHSVPPGIEQIVVLVVETLSLQAVGPDWREVMPHTALLADSGHFFTNHYTPWPFSSKALFSLVCGVYPHASNLIELRLLSQKNCGSWIEGLGKNEFKTYVGYTGQLNYDNMGSFFRSQNFEQIHGRSFYLASDSYSQNDLSVDDKAMFDHYLKWSVLNPKNIGLLITMNSHFPFWAPESFDSPFEDAYKKALNYQDSLVGELIKTLKETNHLEKTMIVITGDHGPRLETHSDFSSTFFKVPLIVWKSDSSHEVTSTPTTHSQISDYIFKNPNHNSEDIFLYSDFGQLKIARLSQEGIDLLNSETLEISSSQTWENSFEVCQNQCKRKAQLFYDFIKKNNQQYHF